MRILIDKAFLYVIGKSYIMETWKNVVFNIKGKHNFKIVTTVMLYNHIVEVPTQKGEHSCKYIELSL